ncbi:hypothetical protein HD806DRAFT_530651 [Xylariaceae sp. AK1471]|nr:hypothetical protein HD806DRAFT_530651 [Xylariaceae sp. AK1471]
MPETPRANPLAGVIREKEAIQEAVANIYSFDLLDRPSAQQVLVKMKDNEIVHFACHGYDDRADPSASHLLLQQPASNNTLESTLYKLTVSTISSQRSLNRAWIALLSACSTARVKLQKLADEGIHLVSAF